MVTENQRFLLGICKRYQRCSVEFSISVGVGRTMISRKVFSLPVGSVPISRNLNKKLVVSSETNLGVRGRRIGGIGGIGGI